MNTSGTMISTSLRKGFNYVVLTGLALLVMSYVSAPALGLDTENFPTLSIDSAPELTEGEIRANRNALRNKRKEKGKGGKSSDLKSAPSAPQLRTLSSQSPGQTSALTSTIGTVETQLLARALKYDADLIFEYVQNNIEYDVVKGFVRNATATTIAEVGTAFDQANLMVELLRISDDVAGTGYNPKFVIGDIQIEESVYLNWLALPGSLQAVYNTLSNKGHQVSGAGTGTVTLDHVWVRLTAGGATYDVDPSFKAHAIKPGVDIAGELSSAGYNRSSFISSGLAGASYVP